LTTPRDVRGRATSIAVGLMTMVIMSYAIWPGENERQALTLSERWHNVLAKREWYLIFPAAGLGLYSGALAFLWAFPYSVAIVLFGAVTGGLLAARLLSVRNAPHDRSPGALRLVLATGILIVLVNLPLIVTEVGYSARTFTPTWLVLCGALAAGASRAAWKRVHVLGVLGGTFAAFAWLSLALSVSVRVRTDEFNRAAAHWIADRTKDGAVVAVCDVDRTVSSPAPLGAFHLHQFHSTWGAWVEYHTGRIVEIRRSGERYWGSRCPDLAGADLVVSFPKLVHELLQ
jgi:hypothetical protein